MSPQTKPGDGRHNKRRKELARAKEARQAARRADREHQQRRRNLVVAGVAALVVAVAVLAVVFWPSSDSSEPDVAASATPTASGASPSATAKLTDCVEAPQANPSPSKFDKAPEGALPDAQDLVLKTNCGTIEIRTEPKRAPKTVAAMLGLAQKGYFDKTPCHRLTTAGIFVLQCGDPTGAGTGSPGFTIPDENLPGADGNNYPAGTVAMANAGPGTSGSQFFIVYKDTKLPANYTIWGKVTKGLKIVENVAAAGVMGGGTDGPPAQPIGIIKATPDPKLAG